MGNGMSPNPHSSHHLTQTMDGSFINETLKHLRFPVRLITTHLSVHPVVLGAAPPSPLHSLNRRDSKKHQLMTDHHTYEYARKVGNVKYYHSVHRMFSSGSYVLRRSTSGILCTTGAGFVHSSDCSSSDL